MCNVVIPIQPKLSREDARAIVRKSINESKDFHKSIRSGSWKPSYDVNIVSFSK